MRSSIRIVAVVGVIVAAGALYLLTWPVPIDPVSWEAPTFDPSAWRATASLAMVERAESTNTHGPEDVEVDAQGRIYAGLADGRILRWDALAATPTLFAETGGRPLGLHWDGEGNLLVADAFKGLLAIDPTGNVEVLTTECGGRRLVFTDDLDTAADGTIWFTDASERFRQSEWKLDILETGPNGRLCAFDSVTRTAREVIGGLYFANGVAVDPQQQFVLVNETSRYRVQRVWLAGPKAGQREVVIENLPGFPDGISTGTNGVFWIAIASPRNLALDMAADKPWLRKVMSRLPSFLQPSPERTARVIGIDRDGNVVHDLFDPEGSRIYVVTSVQERDGFLYLGSLVDTAWARYRLR